MGAIDLYCERIGAAFWGEPINALTNVAFVLGALAAWHLARRLSALTTGVWTLIGLASAIGIGSFVFHTVATAWARLLDIGPILLFQVVFLWLYGRKIFGIGRLPAGALIAGFLAFAVIGRQFPHVFNGSLAYAPAIVIVLVLGVYHANAAERGRYDLLAAAAVLAVALACRTIDNMVCTSFPLGTHFLWHLFNGLVVYLSMRAVILNQPLTVGSDPRKTIPVI